MNKLIDLMIIEYWFNSFLTNFCFSFAPIRQFVFIILFIFFVINYLLRLFLHFFSVLFQTSSWLNKYFTELKISMFSNIST